MVEGINDAPAAISSQWVLREDEALSLQVSGVDLDADELSFSMAQLPSHGVLEGSLPNIIYHPELNFLEKILGRFLSLTVTKQVFLQL